MSAVAAPLRERPGTPPRRRRAVAPVRTAAEPTLPVPVARGIAFVLLAGFAGLHWMSLLAPRVPGRAGLGLLVAAGAALGLLWAGQLPGRARPVAATLVAILAVALAAMAGGVPAELLRISNWGELAGGVTRGIEALPGVRVPYRGVDPWIRLIIPAGGTVLMVGAALLAFWPRRAKLGRPLAALLALVTLYAVPTVTLYFGAEFLRGAVLAVLVLAFLRLERVRSTDARTAGWLAAGVVVAALAIGPAIDENAPWWDYEAWALEASTSKTTSYSWNHSYGPLNWPRDGREMIRVRARRPAYWKAENLSRFDGEHWVYVDNESAIDGEPRVDDQTRRRWTETIRVSVRNLRSPLFITGGQTTLVDAAGVFARARGDGTFASGRMLTRGDVYSAQIYSPQPNERERRAVPPDDGAILWPYLRLQIPASSLRSSVPDSVVDFPRYGEVGTPVAAISGSVRGNQIEARRLLTLGPFAGVWRLAQRLKRGTETQEDYVGRVLRYLAGGQFTYSETPPAASRTLPGFLLRGKAGYCQQFSGAMALLLRMGGVPARVATGFTSGALDRKAKEYVVRDLDAHSWVEVYYPTIGWVTFDPTPAVAPPRAQPEEAGLPSGGLNANRPPVLPGDRGSTRQRLPAVAEPAPWWRVPLLVVVGVLAVGALALAVRRLRRPPLAPLAELERALRRARRGGRPATTLSALERAFAASPAAAGYVRAVRDARYGGRPGLPTRAQRRALRGELARGGGVAGRLRAWWALPPV